MNVFDILEQTARNHGERAALCDEQGTLSYTGLLLLARDLADALAEQGIRPGMGVGLQVPNGRTFVGALFALASLKAVAVPMGMGLTDTEVQQVRADLPLHAFVTGTTDTTHGAAGSPAALAVSGSRTALRMITLRAGHEPFAPHVPDAVFVRPTSGTTGRSKGVILSHRTVLERTAAAQEALQLSPDDRVLWVLPMAYHFVVSVLLYVRTASCMVVCKNNLAATICETATAHNASVLYAGPAHYQLLAAAEATLTLPPLRLALCTSGGISGHLCDQFERRYGTPLRQLFGIIEAGLPLGNLAPSPAPRDTVGSALPGFELSVFDDSGGDCPPGTVGELAIRGPGMFDAYLNPPLPRSAVLQNGWFLTGDLAVKGHDGTFRIAGRRKSVIIVAGNKVHPEEVEAIIDSHRGVTASRAFAAPHPLTGETVSVEVVRNDSTLGEDDLRRFCRSKLSSYKVPHTIRFVDSIPRTPTGKVLRREP